MVKTESTQSLPLGTPAPPFVLPDGEGQTVSLDDLAAPALVVAFLCNHCPFVKHIRDELAAFGREVAAKGVAVVGINSNDVEHYPDDAPELMVVEAREAGYTFPYLYDETQAVARAYHAACTPDFFVFDGERQLVYRGQFDGSRPGNDIPVTGEDLRAAVDAALSEADVPSPQLPSIGCNIKWKPGQEPDHFRAR